MSPTDPVCWLGGSMPGREPPVPAAGAGGASPTMKMCLQLASVQRIGLPRSESCNWWYLVSQRGQTAVIGMDVTPQQMVELLTIHLTPSLASAEALS
jgi:hypothetical protein